MKREPKFLMVKNYHLLQHTSVKRLPWIKLYDKLLEDYAFALLTEVQQNHLVKIWLLANRTQNKIPNDANWVRTAIRASSVVRLDALRSSGWLVAHKKRKGVPGKTPANPEKVSRQSVDPVKTPSALDREGDREGDRENQVLLAREAANSTGIAKLNLPILTNSSKSLSLTRNENWLLRLAGMDDRVSPIPDDAPTSGSEEAA